MVTKTDISLVRSLADKRARVEHGLFVVEGRKMVEEAVASGFVVRRIFATDQYASMAGVELAGVKDIERMSNLRTPQGVLALVEIPRYGFPYDIGCELAIALDGVQDPGNLGTIIRIADWFGVGNVVCSDDSADCFNPKVVQATMGAIFRVKVHYASLPEVLAQTDVPIYGTFLDGENIYKSNLGNALSGIIVMGNEGSGISPDVMAKVTHKLYIPPYPAGTPASESLNVATATAVICSEFRRRE